MSHRHDHDDGGQHGARQTGDEGEADQDRREQRPGVDHPGTPGMTAERAVRRAGPDVDAAGYAAGGRGDSVGQAEAHQHAVAVGVPFAWRPGQPGAQHRVDRRDQRQRHRAGNDDVREGGKAIKDRGVGQFNRGRRHDCALGRQADGGAERRREPAERQPVVDGDADAEADQQRRYASRDPARAPHGHKRDRSDDYAQRSRVGDLPERPGEGHVVRVAEDVAELHEEQQRRRHILKAGHNGMGGKFDQRAEAQEAKQRLKDAAEPDDHEQHQQRESDGSPCEPRRRRMRQ